MWTLQRPPSSEGMTKLNQPESATHCRAACSKGPGRAQAAPSSPALRHWRVRGRKCSVQRRQRKVPA